MTTAALQGLWLEIPTKAISAFSPSSRDLQLYLDNVAGKYALMVVKENPPHGDYTR